MSTTWHNSPFDQVQHAAGTAIESSLEMEARIRQRVVESRRKKKTSGENAAPTTKADLPCADPSASHLPPSDRTDHGEMAHHPPANSSSQSILSLLAAQQQRLAEEIACAKAQLERVKPKSKSTADKRMRKRELWPESNPQAMIIYISDDEEDDIGASNPAKRLGVITNRL